MKKILVIGETGQVARALAALDGEGASIRCVGRPAVDIADAGSVRRAVDAAEPDVIVNAAAYTAVDRAESEPDAAFAINGDGARHVAAAAAAVSRPVIHLSTDYVFRGDATRPYRETDPTDPANVYGRSKRAGELAVAEANPAHVVLRTAWVYAPWGQNFALTMLRLAGSRDSVRVVADQFGTPTYAPDLAKAIIVVAQRVADAPADEAWRGILHATSGGATSWAGFAEAVFAASAAAGGPWAKVEGIPAREYPTAATRPANSRLDTSRLRSVFGHALPDWRDGVTRWASAVSG